jgi:hypothetical protein
LSLRPAGSGRVEAEAAERPRPLVDSLTETGFHRVEDDVRAGLEEVLFACDGSRREALCEEGAVTSMTVVEALRVLAVEMLDALRQISPPRLDHEVVMRRHQAIRVAMPAISLGAVPQEPHESTAVGVIHVDRSTKDAARDDMEVAIWQARTEQPWDRANVALGRTEVATCGAIAANSAHPQGQSIATAAGRYRSANRSKAEPKVRPVEGPAQTRRGCRVRAWVRS